MREKIPDLGNPKMPDRKEDNESKPYEFPSITERITLEDALKITKEYLEHVSELIRKTPGGDFESGGIRWNISMPWNFRTTYLGGSILKELFGSDDVMLKTLIVDPLSSGHVPRIYMETETGETAEIELKDDVLNYVVYEAGEDESGNKQYSNSGKLKDGKIEL